MFLYNSFALSTMVRLFTARTSSIVVTLKLASQGPTLLIVSKLAARIVVSILSKLDGSAIDDIYNQYVGMVGNFREFNLFELVMNNYLLATVYSDAPESLKISKVDAELLIREIKMDTLDIMECVDQLIDKYGFEGYRAEYVKKYGKYLKKRISLLKNASYFGELFLVNE